MARRRRNPSYQDIKHYADMLQRVSTAARDEFLRVAGDVDFSDLDVAREQLQTIVQDVLDLYGLAAQDLGAQWFEFCEELAFDAEPSQLVGDTSQHSAREDVDSLVDNVQVGIIDQQRLMEMMQNIVVEQTKNRAKSEINARLQEFAAKNKDKSGGGGGKDRNGFSRVPVGDTCAFCILLASRGFDYVSEKTARSADHLGCNCVIVPFHDAKTITGYEDQLAEYQQQYEDAKKLLENPPPELQKRLDIARSRHDAVGENPWSSLNEVTIAMRYSGVERGFRAETAANEEVVAAAAEAVVDEGSS